MQHLLLSSLFEDFFISEFNPCQTQNTTGCSFGFTDQRIHWLNISG